MTPGSQWGSNTIAGSLAIVCSDEPRNGKTLIARLLADIHSLSGEASFRLFDTDYPDGDLAGYFPTNTQIIDFHKIGGQVQLFDTIIGEPDFDYVIDLDSGLLKPFFKVFSDIAFDKGAQEAGLNVFVYFLLDRKISTVESALIVSRLAGSAQFIPIRNEAMGNILAVPSAASLYGQIRKSREIILPRLTVNALNFIDRDGFSFADFLSRNGTQTPIEIRYEIWDFLEAIYNQRRASEDGGSVSL